VLGKLFDSFKKQLENIFEQAIFPEKLTIKKKLADGLIQSR
jgi:hypothetical protein